MKTLPVPSFSLTRIARNSAVAVLALTLGLMASAQTSNGTGTDTSGTSGATGSSSGSMTGTGSTSSSKAYGTSGTTARDDESLLKHSDKRFLTKAAESSEREVALSQLAAQRATNPQVRDFAQQLVSQHEQMNQQLIQLASRKGVTLEGDRVASMGAGAAGESTARVSNASGVGSNSDAAHSSGANSGLVGVGGRPASSHPSDGSTLGTASTMATDATAATSDRHYRSLVKKTGADFDKEYVSLMVSEHKSDVKLFEKAAKDAKDPEVRTFASQHGAALQTHLDHARTLDKSVAE